MLKYERSGRVYSVEVYVPNRNNKLNKDQFSSLIIEITKSAWGNPGLLAGKWLELADILLVALDVKNKPVAFAIGNYTRNDLVVLVSTMVVRSLQNSGIAKYLNSFILKKAFIRKLLSCRFFTPLYFSFRTPNPTLYSLTSKKTDLFPNVSGRKANQDELEIFDLIVEKFSKNSLVDREKFVIFDAYTSYPDLIYKNQLIPWSWDEKVNDLFEDSLKLTHCMAATMVIIGKVNISDMILSKFKKNN